MTYNTLNFEDAVLETHRKYIDIQAVVDGRELLCWAPKEGLEVKKKYDEDKDAEFYIPPETMPSKNIMTPGMFGVFFPEDAHMPQVSLTKQSESVKKVVIKIKKSLLKIGA
jgi:YhcH/YjgK/YiaL family protein